MRSFDPRPDQIETIAAITAALTNEGTRATAVLPCGYGKTFVAQQAAEQLTAQLSDPLILVAVPNLVLVDQMIQDWQANASVGYAFTALPVNSRSGRKTEDEITGIAIEGVTSDIDQIARFMADPGRRVIFSTYQSMDTIAASVRKVSVWRPGFAFDLAIADEAHRTAGPVRGAEPSVYKTILDNEKIPAHRRSFYTATPRVASKKASTDEHPYSMDYEGSFGPTVVNKSLTWAQDQGLLAEHDVFVVNVDDAGLHGLLEANPTIRVDGSGEEARLVAAAIALAQTARQRNLGGVITYHSSIANAQAFQRILATVVDSLPALEKPTGQLLTGHVNGAMRSNDRTAQLALLDAGNRNADDWAVVTNCSCLSEGVNIPSMDAVAFVDPRSSLIDIVQAVGRPLRRDRTRPDKRATVLIPAYIGSAQSVEEAIEEGRYEAAFQVIRALADSDDALAASFRESPDVVRDPRPAVGPASIDPGRGARETPQGRITIVAPAEWARAETKIDSAADWASWHDSIRVEIFNRQRQPWDLMLASFARFVSTNNRLPKFNEACDGRNIGIWLNDQASKARKGRLSEDRAIRLAAIAPGWLGDRYQAAFQRRVELLARFIETNRRLPLARDEFEDVKIGQWLAKCRTDRRRGDLIQDRYEAILAVAPTAFDGADELQEATRERSPITRQRKGFDHMVATFGRFVAENGRTPTTHETFDGLHIGRWLTAQRTVHGKGELCAARAARILSISSTAFDSRDDVAFAKGLASFKSFIDEHRHPPVKTETHAGYKVGNWLNDRRREHRGRKLSRERVDAILAVAPTAFDGIEAAAPTAEAA